MSESLTDERRTSVTAFLLRALRWFRSRAIRVQRVITDNGPGYVSRLFAKACHLLGLTHLRTRPYTPKTNGKAERFIQTLLRKGAYALPHRNVDTHAADLPRWLALYNRARPYAGLRGVPRPRGVHQPPEQPARKPQLAWIIHEAAGLPPVSTGHAA